MSTKTTQADFQVTVDTAWGELVFLSGNLVSLGEWEPAKAVRLVCSDSRGAQGYTWSTSSSISVPVEEVIEYKYFIATNYAEGRVWEQTGNRSAFLDSPQPYVIEDFLFDQIGQSVRTTVPQEENVSSEALIHLIRKSVIGKDEAVAGPFGVRRVTYADYTASGRALTFIEDYIREDVLPLYANTHTESSGTGLQTSRFRQEARQIIRNAFNANVERYSVIFCGSGSTGAINKLVQVLNLRLPADLDKQYHLSSLIPIDQRPVVFIGPYEHHSNVLPWKESIAEVVTIAEDRNGMIDLTDLESKLKQYQNRKLLIGSFSAASNVTGILTDTHSISVLLHQYGALSFWDYAAACPYVEINMEPLTDSNSLDYKDAVFVSPHKLIGGPGTPGLLVAKRSLFTNSVPTEPGGGTVLFVDPVDHLYLSDPEHREEGGTPAIIGSIRAGLAFQLKQRVGVETIRQLEHSFIQRAIASWEAVSEIFILGSKTLQRLSIVSFTIRHADRYLHHNFVVALLNDLFGIQSRGGCSCAGPYGHRLLGIDLHTSHAFEHEIVRGCEGIKPGWVRVSFNYFISDAVFDYLLESVRLIASHGWKLLPWYRFNPTSGLWVHCNGLPEAPLSLHDIKYSEDGLRYPSHRHREGVAQLPDYLNYAKTLFADPAAQLGQPPATKQPHLDSEFEKLRWFWLPNEISVEKITSQQ